MKKIKVAVVLFIALFMTVAAANAAEYGATYAPSNTPKCMIPSQTKTVSITVTNTGTLTWTPGTYNLSYHWFEGSTTIVFDGLRTGLPAPVAPGGHATLNAQVQAPDHAGNFTLKWDMVQESVTWFSSQGVPTKDQAVTVSGMCDFKIDPNKYKAYRKCWLKIGCPNCPPGWASKFDLVSNPSEKFKLAVARGDAKAKRLAGLQRRFGELAARANNANAAQMGSIEKEAQGILVELEQMGM